MRVGEGDCMRAARERNVGRCERGGDPDADVGGPAGL